LYVKSKKERYKLSIEKIVEYLATIINDNVIIIQNRLKPEISLILLG